MATDPDCWLRFAGAQGPVEAYLVGDHVQPVSGSMFGTWKLWSVAIDEFYMRTNGQNWWTRVPAEPAQKTPDILLTIDPPDIPLTALGQRQQGFIPGSTQLNPYVHNGPAYPGWPSAVPMWFHYVNPVSGRVPPNYCPDHSTCYQAEPLFVDQEPTPAPEE